MSKTFIILCISLIASYADLAQSAEQMPAQASPQINASQIQKILQDNPNLILDILRQNSEAVLDIAQQGSNLRRKHNLEAQWQEDMDKKKDVKLADRPVWGNPKAPVQIVAFSDFSCHYCEQASKTIDAIMKDYGPDVSFVFKHLPLDDKGPGAQASIWFIAIAQQNEPAAWEFYKTMYANRDRLLGEGEPFIKETAQKLNLDMKRLEKDLQSKKVKEIMSQDQEDAQKLGVEGTPYFLVNNLVIRGALPLELFKTAVDMAKANK